MEEAQDFYIIAVYTAHCTVNNQDYIIPIINPDHTAESGLRIILRPTSHLYKQIRDKLEAQDIELDYTGVNEYILKHPINIGKWMICDNNSAGKFIESIRNSIAYQKSDLSGGVEEIFFAFSLTPWQTPLEGTVHDTWNACFGIPYSLELYSIFCKGNYIYSSLRYQKAAIKTLIEIITIDYDCATNLFFDRPFTELSKIEVKTDYIVNDNDYNQPIINCKLFYPEINMTKIINHVSNITPFFHGFAITSNEIGNGIIDIKGEVILDSVFEYIAPLRYVQTNIKDKYVIQSYVKCSDNLIYPFVIMVKREEYKTGYINEAYDKIFLEPIYDIGFRLWITEDEIEERLKYLDSTVYIMNHKFETIHEYNDIKDIQEAGKSGYYFLKRAESKTSYDSRGEAMGIFKLTEHGSLKEVIAFDESHYHMFHLTEKLWLIWNDDAYNSGWRITDANLNLEKECTDCSNMSGYIIDNSQNAMIFHEDKGFITRCGDYQSYDIANYDSEPVLILYSGKYSEYYDYKGDREVDYEQDYSCTCFDMEGGSFTTHTDDELIQRSGW